jgi:hypothetical protein
VSFRLKILAALLPLAGCAGPSVRVDTSDRVVRAQTPSRQPLSYRFGPVPDQWERIDIPQNDVAWHDRETDGVIHVDHRCASDQDVPLPSLVQHLLIGFTDREIVSEETIPFDQREARHVVVRARLDGVPQILELYVMKKDGCVYDLGYVASPTRFEQGRPAFETFVRGFSTVQTGMQQRSQGGGP